MNRNSGNHIGDRLFTYDRTQKNPLNTLLLTGFTLQTLVLLHLALTPTKPTTDACPSLHIGTTGNVYISEPRGNGGSNE